MKKLWLMISMMTVSLAGYAGVLAEWSAASANAANDITFEATMTGSHIDGVETLITLGETYAAYYPLNSDAKFSYQAQNDLALNTNKYISVTVKTDDEGYMLNLTNIWMTAWRPNNGATNLTMRWSLDDFSSDLDHWTIDPEKSNRTRRSIALDMPVATNQVEFRVYLWDGVGYGTTYLSDDGSGTSVSIEGVVLVPIEDAVVLAEWSDAGLSGGFAANPVWSNKTVAAGVDTDATLAKLDETKTNGTYYGSISKMTYQLQNDTAMNLNKYAQIFIAPEAGQQMTLSSLSLTVASTENGAQNAAVRSSVDDFSSNLASIDLVRGSNNLFAIELGTAEFSELDSSVEFRVYLWNAAGYQTAFLADGTGATSIAIEGVLASISGYTNWASVWGVDIGAATNDYDGDGLLNINEYGLGGDPTNPENLGISPVFVVDNSGANLIYTYPQLSDLNSGLNYYIELTDDLVNGSWANTGYTVIGTGTPGGDFDYVTNQIPADIDQRFVRLMIEQL